jgi:hypothetical protein
MKKDEEDEDRVCPTKSGSTTKFCIQYKGIGPCIEDSDYQESGPERKEIICKDGYENCTEVEC